MRSSRRHAGCGVEPRRRGAPDAGVRRAAAAPAKAPKKATAGAVVAGLQPGATGSAVVDLQRAMTRFGWPVVADGVYGARTQAAVRAIQQANGLAATGTVDDRTARLLRLGTAAAATPAAPAPAAPVSSRAATAVAAAQSQLGVPYVAFQQAARRRLRLLGPHRLRMAPGRCVACRTSPGCSTRPCRRCAKEQAQPGDLLFYKTPISHVTIYIGNGRMIHAPVPAASSRSRIVNWANVVAVARPG